MTLCVRSPLRIDFVGMTDYRPACAEMGGEIVNAPINKYIYATLRARQDGEFHFHAPDQNGLDFSVPTRRELSKDGPLGLVQHIVKKYASPSGLDLTTYSELPGGAGLGSSSAVATCVIAAVNALTGYCMTDFEIADAAIEAEAEALDVQYGWQDQYSPVTGSGVKYLRWWPGGSHRGIEIDILPLTAEQMADLEKSLVICYTQQSRPAGNILAKVADGFRDRDESVLAGLAGMNECARDIRIALLNNEPHRLGHILNRVWELHKGLHPDVSNDLLENMHKVATDNGALGGRVCGAGGGGTMMFYCEPGTEYTVKRRLEEAGGRIFDFSFAASGLQVWHTANG